MVKTYELIEKQIFKAVQWTGNNERELSNFHPCWLPYDSKGLFLKDHFYLKKGDWIIHSSECEEKAVSDIYFRTHYREID